MKLLDWERPTGTVDNRARCTITAGKVLSEPLRVNRSRHDDDAKLTLVVLQGPTNQRHDDVRVPATFMHFIQDENVVLRK